MMDFEPWWLRFTQFMILFAEIDYFANVKGL